MPDPINNTETTKPAEGGVPDWLGVKGRFDLEPLVPSSVTSDGIGGSAGVQVEYGSDDEIQYGGLEYKHYDTDGDRGDGTTPNNTLNVIGVVVGSTQRHRDAGGVRKVVVVSGSESTIGVGWLGVDNSDHYVDGVTNENTGSEKEIYLSKTVYGGVEFYAGDRFVIMPKVGLSMGTFYPFDGVKDQSRWFASPRSISLLFGLNIGYNDNGGPSTQEAKLSDLAVAGQFAGDTIGILQTMLAHKLNAATVRGQGLFCDNKIGCGPSSQQTEDIAPMQALSSGFGALGVGDEVGFIYKAWDSNRRAEAIVKLAEEGVAGLAFLAWGASEGAEGADLSSSGLTNLQVGLAGLMSLSTLDPLAQDAIRWGLGSALLLLGGAADSAGLVAGGMNGALGVTWSPAATRAKIISATTYSYYPRTKFSGDQKGSRGVLRKVEHMPVATNLNLTMSSEINTHALGVGNAEGRVENAATEKDDPYSSVYLPTRLGSGLGMEYELHLGDRVIIAPAVDVFAAQEFGSYSKAGIGAGAELALMVRVYKKVYLDVRTRATVEKMIDGGANTELMPIAAGLTFYTDDLFLF